MPGGGIKGSWALIGARGADRAARRKAFTALDPSAAVRSVRVPQSLLSVVAVAAVVAATFGVLQVDAFAGGRNDVARDQGCFCHGEGSNNQLLPNEDLQDGQPDPGVEVTLTHDVPAAGYVPEAEYTFTVEVACGTSSVCETDPPEDGHQGGFNVEVTAGTLPDPGSDAAYKVTSDGRQATHNGEDGNKQRNWTVTWTAPERGAGTVKVYVVANAVDGDNTYGEDDRWNWVDYDGGDVTDADKHVAFPEGQVPDAPPGVDVQAEDGTLNVTWGVPDAHGFDLVEYVVHRNDTSGDLVERARVPAGTTTFVDDEVAAGVRYDYAVSAVSEVGEGDLSSIVQGVIVVPPDPPRDLTVRPGDAVVALSWTAPAKDRGAAVTEYRVYRGTSPDALALLASTTGTAFDDGTVDNDVTYNYAVAAVNAAGEGSHTPTVEATPRASLNLPPTVAVGAPAEGATVNASLLVHGTASDPEDALDRVEVRVDGADWLVADGVANWSIALQLSPGDHSIEARAWDAADQTSAVVSRNVTVPGDGDADDVEGDGPTADLPAPGNLTVTRIEAGHRLTWDPVPGVEGYAVERSLGGPFFRLAETNATTFTDTALVPGAVHRYRVSALASGGAAGEASAPVETSVEGGPVEALPPSFVVLLLAVVATAAVLVVLHRLG